MRAARVTDVVRVCRVVEGRRITETSASQPGALVDDARCARIRRRHEHEIDPAAETLEERRERSRVTGADICQAPLASGQGVAEVGTGYRDPAFLQLDTDAAPVQGCRLDKGGADPAHGVDDDVAWLRVREEDPTRQLGQHLAGVPGRNSAHKAPLAAIGRSSERRPRRRAAPPRTPWLRMAVWPWSARRPARLPTPHQSRISVKSRQPRRCARYGHGTSIENVHVSHSPLRPRS